MSEVEILDPVNQEQRSDIALRHSVAVMSQWANGEVYDEKIFIERGKIKFQEAQDAFFEFGRVLVVLKEHMPHGHFQETVKREFNIDPSVARRMIKSTVKFCSPELLKSAPKLIALGRSKLFELMSEDSEDLAELAEGGSVNGLTLDDVDRMTVSELRAALKDSRDDLEAARKVSASKQEAIDELNHQLEKTRKKLADADPAKVGEELHATLNAAQTGVRSALTQIQPVLVQLIEHGQANGVDHAPTMVGCLNQIIRDCEYLRETYGLPREAPTDATPAWLKDEN